MRNRKKMVTICLAVMLVTGLLASCGARPTAEPTADVNLLATNAAQTIEARFTETALAMPTDTPMPTYTQVAFTATPAEGSITLPTAGAGAVGIPTIGAAPTTAPVTLPTATLAAVGDQAAYSSQSIADKTHMKAGESADLIWYLTNVGTTTWTTDYSVRFYSGTNFAKAGNSRYRLPAAVAPTQTGQVVIDIVAPNKAGEYKMAWVLSNAEDVNFFVVDFTLIVD